MADNNQQSDQDFFSYLAQNSQQLDQPISKKKETKITDEQIIFMDESGKMKILQNGQVLDFKQNQDSSDIQTQADIAIIKPDLEFKASEIVDQLQPGLVSQDNRLKLASLIKTRLNGVRSNLQIRSVLIDSKLDGGFGFDDIFFGCNNARDQRRFF